VIAFTSHGVDFASVIAKGSIFGVQFHPEKSGEPGALILSNFKDMLMR
jgi:glutamine amidotransferase